MNRRFTHWVLRAQQWTERYDIIPMKILLSQCLRMIQLLSDETMLSRLINPQLFMTNQTEAQQSETTWGEKTLDEPKWTEVSREEPNRNEMKSVDSKNLKNDEKKKKKSNRSTPTPWQFGAASGQLAFNNLLELADVVLRCPHQRIEQNVNVARVLLFYQPWNLERSRDWRPGGGRAKKTQNSLENSGSISRPDIREHLAEHHRLHKKPLRS